MKILIIKLSSMGDVIHGMPVVRAIQKIRPDAEVHWLVSSQFASLVEMCHGIRKIHRFNRLGWKKPFRIFTNLREYFLLIKKLRRERYDTVVDLQCLFRSGVFAWLTGCPLRMGLDHAREGASMFYTRRVPSRMDRLHAVDQNMQVIPALFPDLANPGFPEFSLRIPLEADTRVAHKLKTGAVKPPFVVMAPAARWESKMWPADYFRVLARKIRMAGNAHVIVTGVPEENPTWRDWPGFQENGIHNWLGKTTLQELAVLVQHAACLVSNDSGPMHLAACFGTPVAALMGPTRPGKTGPVGPARIFQEELECAPCFKRVCPRRDHPKLCLTRITPDQVFEAIRQEGWLKR